MSLRIALHAIVLALATALASSHAAHAQRPAPVLEIYALDIWAQPLPASIARIAIARNGAAVGGAAVPVSRVPLQAGRYRIALSATDHHSAVVDVTSDGVRIGAAVASSGTALSRAQGVFKQAGQAARAVYTLYVGLRHKWFAAHGRPARRGNLVRLLMNGEEAWGTIYQDLLRARRSVHLSTWWWESNFELIRDAQKHMTLSPQERERNSILGVLRAIPATKRVLVNQFLGQDGALSWATSDDAVRSHGPATGDNFEFMGQGNLTRGIVPIAPKPQRFVDRVRAVVPGAAQRTFAAENPIAAVVTPRNADLTRWPVKLDVPHSSHHQKFGVIDGNLAYIGGMNFRRVDWDTSAHHVFDARRMLPKATAEERAQVAARKRKPDTGPRKDYILRVLGPSAQDAADVFRVRWEHNLRQKAAFADKSTAFQIDRNIAPLPGGVQAQVTATLPPPFNETDILETWLNAVENARQYIYIEDQYFRIPVLNDAIARRMTALPGLRLIVITKPVSEWTDPGCEWTHRSHALFSRFGARYQMLQLRAFSTAPSWGWDNVEGRFADIDLHGKIMLVDDTFLSVGSANKNNRGVYTESELNTAVVDRAWVTAQRRRLLAAILPAGTNASDDVNRWATLLAQHAKWNDAVFASWKKQGNDIRLAPGQSVPANLTPRGFVYSLGFRATDKCLLEGVGPDMT